MEFWIIFNDILILLGASLIAGTICSRLGQSPVVGYLLAGTMLGGPGSFRLVSSQHAIESISELGVALLLFSLGLEFSAERIKKLGIKSLIAGILQGIVWVFY